MDEDRTDTAARATDMLAGKRIARIESQRSSESMIECADGTRLYIDCNFEGLDLSVTSTPGDTTATDTTTCESPVREVTGVLQLEVRDGAVENLSTTWHF